MKVFKEHKDILLPTLLLVYRQALQLGDFPKSMKVVVFCQSQVKTLANILAVAQQLIKETTHLIHKDQLGFMPAKSTAIKIRQLWA